MKIILKLLGLMITIVLMVYFIIQFPIWPKQLDEYLYLVYMAIDSVVIFLICRSIYKGN
jgi:hypothetical protein